MPSAKALPSPDPVELQRAIDALDQWATTSSKTVPADARWAAIADLTARALKRPIAPLRDPLLIPLA